MDTTPILKKVKSIIDTTYLITPDGIFDKIDNYKIVDIPIKPTNNLKLKTNIDIKQNKNAQLYVDSIDKALDEYSGKAYTMQVTTNKIIMFEHTMYVDNYKYDSFNDAESYIEIILTKLGNVYQNLINFTINKIIADKTSVISKIPVAIETKLSEGIKVKGGKKQS